MRESNVLHISFGRRETHSAPSASCKGPEQLELFDHAYGAVRAISYFDIASLDQDRLIRSVTMNAVRTIIDLRGVPVFPKPKFNHRFLMSYFYDRSVDYIECAMIEKANTKRFQSNDLLSRWLVANHSGGITACIIDDVAIHDGVVAAFRTRITKTVNTFVEVHPRSLI